VTAVVMAIVVHVAFVVDVVQSLGTG